jgi:hypothetical protein
LQIAVGSRQSGSALSGKAKLRAVDAGPDQGQQINVMRDPPPNQEWPSMKTGRIPGAALMVLLGCRGAFAEPCVITNRQIYNLVADTVNWSMKVENDQKCRYGIRYAKVQFESMTLLSPPRSGQVVLQGSAFTYEPKKDFQGDDSFDLKVAGQIQKVRGVSTIHVVVSVRSATKSAKAAPSATTTTDSVARTVPVTSSGGPTPPIKPALGPAPLPAPPAPGTVAPLPVPQLSSGPAPTPMLPQPGAASPPIPIAAASAAPPPSLLPVSATSSPPVATSPAITRPRPRH